MRSLSLQERVRESLQNASDSLTTFAICCASLPSLPLAHGSGQNLPASISATVTRET